MERLRWTGNSSWRRAGCIVELQLSHLVWRGSFVVSHLLSITSAVLNKYKKAVLAHRTLRGKTLFGLMDIHVLQ